MRAHRRSLAGSSGAQRLQGCVDGGVLATGATAVEQQGAVNKDWLGLPPAAVPRSCAASDHVVGEAWENTKIQISKKLSNWHFPLKNLIKGDRFPQEFKCHIHIYSACIHIPYKGVPICCSRHNLSNVKSVITQIDYLGPSIHLVINMNCNLATSLIPSLYYLSPEHKWPGIQVPELLVTFLLKRNFIFFSVRITMQDKFLNISLMNQTLCNVTLFFHK